MLMELIATFIAGFAGAGVAMLLNRIVGGRLPRWLTPVAAGAAMLIATLSAEYGWYNRTSAALPDGLTVARAVEKKPGFRVWAYVFPYVDRFAAVDLHSIKTNDALPDQRIADLYLYGRWAQIQKMPVIVDCRNLERAQLTEGSAFADDGSITGVAWIKVPAGDPVLTTICEG